MNRLSEFLVERRVWGDTPLHVAARNNREEAVYALFEKIDAGLQQQMLAACNVEGLTAQEVAGDNLCSLLMLYCTETL